MNEQPGAMAEALERVVVAARAHLAAVTAGGGTPDDPAVWRSYLLLNNASYAYDQLMLETFGEVTPWDTDLIEAPDGRSRLAAAAAGGEPGPDPHPPVVSVRQRRDYRVPSVAALLAVSGTPAPGTVAAAVLELVATGDWSLASLDLPELEPLAGVVTVVESPRALPPGAGDPALFQVGAGERQTGRRDELPFGAGEHRPGEVAEATGTGPGAAGR